MPLPPHPPPACLQVSSAKVSYWVWDNAQCSKQLSAFVCKVHGNPQTLPQR